ncbi:MAG TPA: response regulator [Pyrinomonadaceae bacterium]|jgi:CheY-like chemotaxis protein|nr:response regulator [Pyrinomonadaceae bacterium]
MLNTPSRILFIDDHADTCYMVKAWLGLANYEVATAQSMARGLQLARSEPFDLYLLDTRLPDGSGRELCEKIREFDRTTPIIFYSGDAPDQLDSALECGAQDYVMKPELDGLQKAIFRAMNSIRA